MKAHGGKIWEETTQIARGHILVYTDFYPRLKAICDAISAKIAITQSVKSILK